MVALFYNPLAVPVRFSSVRLCLSGCSHRAISTSVVVPGYSTSYEVELAAVPLQPGTLTVEGVEVCINAAVTCVRVDANGWAKSPLQEGRQRHHYPRAASSSTSAYSGLVRSR